MKVERKKVEPVFEPVVLTLESQAEVDLIRNLFGRLSSIKGSAIAGAVVDSYAMFYELNKYASKEYKTDFEINLIDN